MGQVDSSSQKPKIDMVFGSFQVGRQFLQKTGKIWEQVNSLLFFLKARHVLSIIVSSLEIIALIRYVSKEAKQKNHVTLKQ